MVTPLFSILHPSARPHKWREIRSAWLSACVHPENVEYILCADGRWGFDSTDVDLVDGGWDTSKGRVKSSAARWECVWNTARRCMVDSVNIAAKASTGRILIVIADDQYPCEEWDERLLNRFGIKWPDDRAVDRMTEKDFVVEVSTGTPNEHERGMIVMPILSRARYERLGYVFYPEYESMYADNDFYEHAKQDGCIIDARHLMFPHRHPWNEAVARGASAEERNAALLSDKAYAAQNRVEAYRLGRQVLEVRRRSKFTLGLDGELTAAWPIDNNASAPQTLSSPGNGARPVPGKQVRGSIALALPGENFSGHWVAKILDLTVHLLKDGWNYSTIINYTSMAGVTRQTIWGQIEGMIPQFTPDYILWIDDDQIVDTGVVDLLIADMQALPEADVVAGWTWIASNGPYFNQPQVSCGRMNLEKGEISYADHKSVQSANGVFEVEWTGFPVILMRLDSIRKIGKHPFAHLPCPESPWGLLGEDISFCKRLRDAGGKIFVDSRAFVAHLKLKPLGPSPESKDEIALALSGKANGGFRVFEPAVDRGPRIENWKIGDRDPFMAGMAGPSQD